MICVSPHLPEHHYCDLCQPISAISSLILKHCNYCDLCLSTSSSDASVLISWNSAITVICVSSRLPEHYHCDSCQPTSSRAASALSLWHSATTVTCVSPHPPEHYHCDSCQPTSSRAASALPSGNIVTTVICVSPHLLQLHQVSHPEIIYSLSFVWVAPLSNSFSVISSSILKQCSYFISCPTLPSATQCTHLTLYRDTSAKNHILWRTKGSGGMLHTTSTSCFNDIW